MHLKKKKKETGFACIGILSNLLQCLLHRKLKTIVARQGSSIFIWINFKEKNPNATCVRFGISSFSGKSSPAHIMTSVRDLVQEVVIFGAAGDISRFGIMTIG